MSTTIDSLDIQIKASAGSAATNIGALANSLSKLNKNANLTKVTNNLGKLAGALSTLQTSSSGLSAIREVASAVKSLETIAKPSGLSSAISSLKQIPKITASLDKTTLTDFAAKMRELASALSPLAEKISIVAAGFSKLPSQVSKTVTATNKMAKASLNAASAQTKHNASLNKFSINLAAGIFNIRTAIHSVRAMVSAVASFLSDAIEWDGIQFRFGRAFGEDADEVYAHMQRISEAMEINLQKLMQYSSMFGSLLSGFGLEQEKVSTISVGLTELTYDIWAAHNDRYKSIEDAYEAVRSAITGEIEPIRNAGIALTQASMQEYLDSVGMAHVNVAQLSEAQKAEVRYATMVNAAMNQGIVGTYAREMDTAEGAVRTLTQQLKGLGQALGSLVMPAISAIIPYLTAFVRVLYNVASAIAALFRLPFFSINWGNGTKGLDSVAESADNAAESLGGAGGALKDYTMGFDELNVINPDSGGGGGGDIGGLDWEGLEDLETLWDESVFASVSEKVDELIPKMEKILTVAGLIGGAIALWKIVPAFIAGLDTVRAVLSGLAGNKAAISALTFMGKPELATQTAIWVSALSKVGLAFSSIWGAVSNAATAVATFVGGLSGTTIAVVLAIVVAIASAAYFLYENWDKVVQAVKDFFKLNIAPKLEKMKESLIKAKDALLGILPPEVREALKFIAEKIGDIITKIGEWIKKVGLLGIVGKVFETIGGIVVGVVGGAIAGAISGLVSAIESVVQIFSGVVQTVSGICQLIVAVFTGGDIEAAWQTIWDGVTDVVGGLWNLITKPIGEIVKGILGWWDSLLSNTTTWWSKVKRWFSSNVKPKFTVAYWKSVFISVKDALAEILKNVKEEAAEKWKAIKDWYKDNIAPVFTLAFWQEVFDTLHRALEEKLALVELAWFTIWGNIKTWYETNIAPVFTLEFWQAVFDSIRSAIEEKLGAVQTAWSTTWEAIKTWYSTNIAPMFTAEYWQGIFDSIRSGLQTKLDEAWTAITNFFSISEWKKKIDGAMQTIKDNFKIPDLPRIGLSVYFNPNVDGLRKKIADALGLSGWPSLNWYTYAAGGFPEMGEMFIAREAGPELVGRIGSKTTVANNDQIVEAVSKGVYSAVVAAMSGQGGNNDMNVNVYLDGQQLYASFKKTESERGMNLMGNQLGYAY